MKTVPKNGNTKSWALHWIRPFCHSFLAVSTQRDVPGKGKSHEEDSEPSQELLSHGPSEVVPDSVKLGSPQLGTCWGFSDGLSFELKPKAAPTFSGKLAANGVSHSPL